LYEDPVGIAGVPYRRTAISLMALMAVLPMSRMDLTFGNIASSVSRKTEQLAIVSGLIPYPSFGHLIAVVTYTPSERMSSTVSTS